MIKRVTFLSRRRDHSAEEFRAHWRDPHGSIAARFAGLLAYNQNQVLERLTLTPRRMYDIDGIVELWFGEAAGPTPGRDPDVTRRLVADEPTFLSGLVGYQVPWREVYPRSTYKIWTLGRWKDGVPDATALDALARDFASAPGATHVEVHAVPESTALFTRDALVQEPDPPRASIIVCFGEIHPLGVARDRVLNMVARHSDAFLTDVEVLLTREERVVDATARVG